MDSDRTEDFAERRRDMVERQIRARGVVDENVLRAMATVPREAFVSEAYRDLAYEDQPLPIGAGQTISQPYIVAAMAAALALRGDEKALEIGLGSGYAAAVLARLCRAVFAVERIEALATAGAATLRALGIANVHVRCGDGSKGWPEEAPFDAILVSAGALRAPERLKEQLAVGGRMLVPLGRGGLLGQNLTRITRRSTGEFDEEQIGAVRFVPLVS